MKKCSVVDSQDPPTVFIGIDNGPSGSIGIIEYSSRGLRKSVLFMKTPTYMMQDYTKAKKRISQLDVRVLYKLLKKYKGWNVNIAMERPLVNPMRFVATIVGVRIHQQYIDLCNRLRFPIPISLDSKEWQKKLLPTGTTGEELKKRSREIGNRMFGTRVSSVKHPDCDGILIAEYCRRQAMGY